jgi:pyruvate-ferredoxin/flavodoxin oxidoreductase
MAMVYGNVYVAQVAMGGNEHSSSRPSWRRKPTTVPSLIIAYGHCIAHGIDMSKGLQQQKLAVEAGYWPLYRYDPGRIDQGLNPFQLDSKEPSIPLKEYAYKENRFSVLARTDPEAAERLLGQAQEAVNQRWTLYESMARAVSDAPGV